VYKIKKIKNLPRPNKGLFFFFFFFFFLVSPTLGSLFPPFGA
jgi:hypothetical protein